MTDDTFDADEESVTDAWEGAYIYTSWGYNRTTVNFAQIVDVSGSGKTVVARLVHADVVENERGSQQMRPDAEQYGDAFRLHVRAVRSDPSFRGSYPFATGDEDDGTRLDSFLPFDNSPDKTVHQTPPNHGH
jgi:hypothetical protein